MYSPGFYRENRNSLIQNLIREFPFAILLTSGGDQVSHLPFVLEDSGDGQVTLVGHMARPNPHWQELSENGNCRVIFQGPHGYISPAWYVPKKDNVPTWNYAVVHVSGQFEIIEDAATAFEAMHRMVTLFESKYETGWQLPRGEKAVEGLMKGIVVFRIKDLRFEAKFKLSQMQGAEDRDNVITQLGKSGDQNLVELAEQMKLTSVSGDQT